MFILAIYLPDQSLSASPGGKNSRWITVGEFPSLDAAREQEKALKARFPQNRYKCFQKVANVEFLQKLEAAA